MKLTDKTPKSLNCVIAACPAVFETDSDTYIVIGKQLKDEQVLSLITGRIGKGEIAVEFPKQLLENILSEKF